MGTQASSLAALVPSTKTAIYKKKLFFFPDLDQSVTHTISGQYLEERLEELINIDEVITLIAPYTSPLNDETDPTLQHFFVFFKTQDWWWSIEKNYEGIIMQRSKELTDVLLQCVGENRNHPVSNVRWDDRQDHLNKKYDSNEDAGFAANVFNSTNSDGIVFRNTQLQQ